MGNPSTYVVHSRHDIRIIAAIARCLKKNNLQVRSKGELIRLAVEMLHDILVDEKMVEEVRSFTEAQEIVFNLGFQTKALSRALMQEVSVEAIKETVEGVDFNLGDLFQQEKKKKGKGNEQTQQEQRGNSDNQ